MLHSYYSGYKPWIHIGITWRTLRHLHVQSLPYINYSRISAGDIHAILFKPPPTPGGFQCTAKFRNHRILRMQVDFSLPPSPFPCSHFRQLYFFICPVSQASYLNYFTLSYLALFKSRGFILKKSGWLRCVLHKNTSGNNMKDSLMKQVKTTLCVTNSPRLTTFTFLSMIL